MILSGSPVNSKSIFPFHPPNTGKLSMKTQNKVNVFRCKSPKKMDIKKNLLQRFLMAYRTIKAAAHHEGVQPLFVTLIPRVRFKSECGCRNIPRGTSRAPSAAASPDGKKPRRRFPHTPQNLPLFPEKPLRSTDVPPEGFSMCRTILVVWVYMSLRDVMLTPLESR